jgi:hypothetical protein
MFNVFFERIRFIIYKILKIELDMIPNLNQLIYESPTCLLGIDMYLIVTPFV